jgi:hypothetical protein
MGNGLRIGFNRAPCGSGKSYSDAVLKVTTPGRYLIVRDRVEAIDEYIATLYDLMKHHGTNPIVVSIRSEPNNRGHSVRNEVEALPERYDQMQHVIAIVTHKALMMADFSGFGGWHCTIDETPVILDRQDLVTKRSSEFFERHYALESVHKDWSAVTLTATGWDTTGADLEADDGARYLKVFHDRVTDATPLPPGPVPARISNRAKQSGRQVICNLSDWSEMEDGRRWTWWSLWSPYQLSEFASVEFLANGFDQSVTFALLRSVWPEIDWYETHNASPRTFAHRSVRIEYFARRHVASKSFLESADGIDHLGRIGRYVAERGETYIWTANNAFAQHLSALSPDAKLRPHQAGSNRWDAINSATMVYAAKPSMESRAVMNLLAVDANVWVRSYEHEAILQFMCRTSVRNPASTDTVVLRVYDKAQADYLVRYFEAAPHVTVAAFCVDLGYANLVRTAAGVVARVLTPEEADQKAAALRLRKKETERKRRAAKKAAETAAGIVKVRGRPTGWRKGEAA